MEFTGSAPAYAVSQCVEVVDGAQYVMGGRVRIASASLTEPEVFAEVQYFQSTNCTVTPLGAEFVGAEVAGDTEDLWLDLPETLQQPPVGARSAYVSAMQSSLLCAAAIAAIAAISAITIFRHRTSS